MTFITREDCYRLTPCAMQQAFSLGATAAADRAPRESNPFGGGWLRTEWFNGWDGVEVRPLGGAP